MSDTKSHPQASIATPRGPQPIRRCLGWPIAGVKVHKASVYHCSDGSWQEDPAVDEFEEEFTDCICDECHTRLVDNLIELGVQRNIEEKHEKLEEDANDIRQTQLEMSRDYQIDNRKMLRRKK
jgi:hypothetical protein